MNRIILLTGLILSLAAPVSAQNIHHPEAVQAGIVVSFGMDWILDSEDALFDQLVDHINLYMNDWKLEETRIVDDIGQVDIKLNDFTVTDRYSLRKSQKKIQTIDGEYYMHMRNPKPTRASINYTVKHGADLLTGVLQIVCDKLEVEVSGQPFSNNATGKFGFEFKQIQLGADAIKVKVMDRHGPHLAVDFLQTIMQERVAEFISVPFGAIMSHNQTSDLQEALVDRMVNYNVHHHLFNETAEIDYSIIQPGVVSTDDFLAIIMDGTLHLLTEDEPEEGHPFKSNLPLRVPDLDPVQIIISDYVMQTLLTTTVATGHFVKEHHETSMVIGTYLQDFEEIFGVFDSVRLIMKPVMGYERIRIIGGDDQLSEIQLVIDLHIGNPMHDSDFEVAIIRIKIHSKVNWKLDKIDDQFHLAGEIDHSVMKVGNFYPFYNTRTKMEHLNDVVNFLGPFFQEYVTDLLSEGMKLPLPNWIDKHIDDVHLTAYEDGYFVLSGEQTEREFEFLQ